MRASKIHWLISAGLGVLACMVFAQTSEARKIQGFEAGDPAVTSAGDASALGTFQAEAPPEGSDQFLITSIKTGDGDSLTPVSGTNAITNASLQTFFHGITLLGTEGSGVLIPFTVLAGDTTLSFQYDFLTNEDQSNGSHHNDFAFDALFNSSNALVAGSQNTFATVNLSTLNLFGAQSPFIFHTGYQTLTLNISALAPGNYTLGLGVEDRTTSDANSGLLIDNFQIVPEPSTIGLGLAGAVLLLALRRGLFRRA